jgi:hypothetical protein
VRRAGLGRLTDAHIRIPEALKARIAARAAALQVPEADVYRAYLTDGDARDTRRETRQKETRT